MIGLLEKFGGGSRLSVTRNYFPFGCPMVIPPGLLVARFAGFAQIAGIGLHVFHGQHFCEILDSTGPKDFKKLLGLHPNI